MTHIIRKSIVIMKNSPFIPQNSVALIFCYLFYAGHSNSFLLNHHVPD